MRPKARLAAVGSWQRTNAGLTPGCLLGGTAFTGILLSGLFFFVDEQARSVGCCPLQIPAGTIAAKSHATPARVDVNFRDGNRVPLGLLVRNHWTCGIVGVQSFDGGLVGHPQPAQIDQTRRMDKAGDAISKIGIGGLVRGVDTGVSRLLP